MSFTTSMKEEITKRDINKIESLNELSSFIRFTGQIKKNKITLTMENASVARRIYKDIKSNFGINIKITIRIQKRFRVKQIYILEISDNNQFATAFGLLHILFAASSLAAKLTLSPITV